MKQMKLSVGVSDFEKIRSDGYYYIDKSGWIKGLLKSSGSNFTDATEALW